MISLRDLGVLRPPLVEGHVEGAVDVAPGDPRSHDGLDALAHPPPRVWPISALHVLLAKGPHALIVVVGLRVALPLRRHLARAAVLGQQAVGVDLQRAQRVIVGGLPAGEHAVERGVVVEIAERLVEQLRRDHHGVAEQQHHVLQIGDRAGRRTRRHAR